jgi:esterase
VLIVGGAYAESNMYLNRFASSTEPIDMTDSDEFRSLLLSASDLGLIDSIDTHPRYRSRNVVVNGLRLHLLEWGEESSPTVLLLHGGNQSAHSWDLVSLALAQHFHVIAIDQRAHGDTEWPRDGEASRHTMASDAQAVLELLGIERPVVIGHSMGGIVAMTLLMAHPDLARRAVFVDIAPELRGMSGANEGQKQIRDFISSAREFDSIDDYIDRVAEYDPFRSREHISRTLIYNLMQRSDGKYVSKNGLRRSRDGARPGDELGTRPTIEEVHSITCPALVVRGAQSRVLNPDHAIAFQAALPAGELVTVPECGHNVHSQNTIGFLAVLLPFLSE